MFFAAPPRVLSVVLSLAVLSVASSGCLKKRTSTNTDSAEPAAAAATTKAPAAKPTPAGPVAPKIDYAAVRPNELGRIPVIMYHEVLANPGKKQLSRSVADFKQDLQLLYDAGFRPVNLGDVVNDNIDIPAGTSPVVLTFDDARPSQFKLTETAKSMTIDPDCAVGIMDAFSKTHPDWKMRATFFVLPKSKATMAPFGQIGLDNEKLNYLVTQGMEIGNHTTLHLSMRSMAPAQIQAEIGNAQNAIFAAVPNARIDVMAVPMGKFPSNKANWQYLRKGTYQGKPYEFKAVMDAAWRPMPSPASKEFNPNRLERIDGKNGLNGIRDWITKLTTGGQYQRYVSDGDPNVISFPKGDESLVNTERLKAENKLANAYAPFGGPGGAKPIVSASDGPATVNSAASADSKPIASKPIASATDPVASPVAKPIAGGQ